MPVVIPVRADMDTCPHFLIGSWIICLSRKADILVPSPIHNPRAAMIAAKHFEKSYSPTIHHLAQLQNDFAAPDDFAAMTRDVPDLVSFWVRRWLKQSSYNYIRALKTNLLCLTIRCSSVVSTMA